MIIHNVREEYKCGLVRRVKLVQQKAWKQWKQRLPWKGKGKGNAYLAALQIRILRRGDLEWSRNAVLGIQ